MFSRSTGTNTPISRSIHRGATCSAWGRPATSQAMRVNVVPVMASLLVSACHTCPYADGVGPSCASVRPASGV